MTQKILICGDSFASDWKVKYTDRGEGWPNLLGKLYHVKNLAMAGCGQYKIYKQLVSENLDNYNVVIISHTSPYRLHTLYHPVHNKDKLHSSADFIYNDVKEHAKTFSDLNCVVEYYEKYFDTVYGVFIHSLICEKINSLVKNHKKVIHITNLLWEGFYQFDDMITFSKYKIVPNGMNHYDQKNNQEICKKIIDKII